MQVIPRLKIEPESKGRELHGLFQDSRRANDCKANRFTLQFFNSIKELIMLGYRAPIDFSDDIAGDQACRCGWRPIDDGCNNHAIYGADTLSLLGVQIASTGSQRKFDFHKVHRKEVVSIY